MCVVRSAPDERSSPRAFRSVCKLFTQQVRAKQVVWLSTEQRLVVSDELIDWRERHGDGLNMQNKTKLCICIHTQHPDVAESNQFAD